MTDEKKKAGAKKAPASKSKHEPPKERKEVKKVHDKKPKEEKPKPQVPKEPKPPAPEESKPAAPAKPKPAAPEKPKPEVQTEPKKEEAEKKAVKKKEVKEKKPKPVEKIKFTAPAPKEGAKKKPSFMRQEYPKLKRLYERWRRPPGVDSKKLEGKRGKGALPSIGYGSPRKDWGLHPSGLKPVRIANLKELSLLKSGVNGAIIASQVGRRKRNLIIKEANKLKIVVLNPRKGEV
jgi:large subunit ribosomal protein L32e